MIAYVETLPDVGGFVRFMTGAGRPIARGPIAGVGIPGNQNGYIWIIEPLGRVPFRKLTDFPAGVYPRGVSWSRDGASLVIGLWQAAGGIIVAERATD